MRPPSRQPNRATRPRPAIRHAPKPVGRPVNPPKPPNRGRELNTGAFDGFIRVLPTVAEATLLETPVPTALYAVIGTWFEADVIEATVKNCLANGFSKVFIVDNASPDDTCAVAQAAGATIAQVYKTAFYDDDYRIRLMNEAMARVTAQEKLPSLWWAFLDADEFICGPGGMRLYDYLARLPAAFNTIGVRTVDLYPSVAPYYTSGLHPADCQELALHRRAARNAFCTMGHWKHLLFRTDAGRVDFSQSRGSHLPFIRPQPGTKSPVQRLHEPPPGGVLFHAPFRSKEATGKRLEALCGKRRELGGQGRNAGDDMATGGNGAIKRWRSFDNVYAQRWDQVELPHCQQFGKNVVGISPLPWRVLLPDVTTFPRWYPDPNAPLSRMSLPLV